jgi:hypothetical protein
MGTRSSTSIACLSLDFKVIGIQDAWTGKFFFDFLKPTPLPPIKMRSLVQAVLGLAAVAAAQNACRGDPSQTGYCTTLSFIDRTTSVSGPPTLAECQNTCAVGIFGDAGDWGLDLTGSPPGQPKSVVGFPCGFSIANVPDHPADMRFSMTNQDIADNFQGLIDRFGGLHGGNLAGEGVMECQGKPVRWFVN